MTKQLSPAKKSSLKLKSCLLGLALSATGASVNAEITDITISNLSHGLHFTPILVAAHNDDTQLYQLGQTASDALATMAEGGNITPLAEYVTGMSGITVENPAGGLLAPAGMVSTDINSDGYSHLSLTAMILPSNDGFVGLDSWPIPTEAGTYTLYLNAYDAGSEANDEIINGGGALGAPGIPMAPNGDGGTGAMGVTDVETNETVHVHRGTLGDSDPAGGYSDLDSSIHRWLNPVAKVVITVE
ncbi:spondin domain-containing protein [Agaribacterium sp. ZY112]|uniref:spondin domain-containing protein n=1 Tax=Agaribacterium sp. ZY112 TaxID=3233574 RepID=UPI0035247775